MSVPNVPRPILWVGHNVDWLSALAVVAAYFLHDQGLIAIGESGSPGALVRVGGETIAAAAGLLMVLRGLVERKVRK
jgi:hypothetical protein